MNEIDAIEYSFLGLRNVVRPPGIEMSLAYIVGLVDSDDHRILDTLPAKRIISWLHEVEEQCLSGQQLLTRQNSFFSRYFSGGYYPQTPVMIVQDWSPISTLLELGCKPLALTKEQKPRAAATGIWEPLPKRISNSVAIEDCKTVNELFRGIMDGVTIRAKERRMLISLIAQPGWNYETAIHSLPKWSSQEIDVADRILWKRTPEG